MKTRYLGVTLALLALAGCAENMGEPISEEMFVREPQAAPPVNTAAIAAAPVQSTPLGPDGRPVDPALAMVEEDPYDTVIQSDASGLTERLPDTCKLENFQQYRGGTAADVAGLSVPHRVVGPTDIVTQEYNPMRVNFYTDGSGRITNISCG